MCTSKALKGPFDFLVNWAFELSLYTIELNMRVDPFPVDVRKVENYKRLSFKTESNLFTTETSSLNSAWHVAI